MISADKRFVIVFNGEIYNHLDLRRELSKDQAAPTWKGRSDTESFLTAISVWGLERALQACVGMFAFAVWDIHTRTLALGRDRLGEKPLYYGWQGRTFLFGSELKSLKAHPSFGAEVDRNSLATFLRYGYIPAPRSIFRNVYKLPAGTVLRLRAADNANSKPVPYWSLLDVARQGLRKPFVGSDNDAIEELETHLSNAVALETIADVPIGAFLSGGIDSSTIVALMQAQSNCQIHTFTVGFRDHEYNEADQAQAVAKHLRTDHAELYVTPVEARAVIPKLPELYDEPFGDSSQIPAFLISQLARRNVTVGLSGDGGDELFGGYNRYVWIRKILNYPVALRKLSAQVLMALGPEQWSSFYAFLHRFLPVSLNVRVPGDKAHKLASVLSMDSEAAVYQQLLSTWPNPDTLVIGGHDPVDLSTVWAELANLGTAEDQMMALDAQTYLSDDILCKVDRAAMGVSLETRIPFLDHRVVEFAWRLPLRLKIRNGQGKWILRQLLRKYLPSELIERPKMGFGVPIDSWLRGPLREWAENLLDESRLRQEGFFEALPIREKWAEHLSGRRNWQYQLWNVLMFQAWLGEHG